MLKRPLHSRGSSIAGGVQLINTEPSTTIVFHLGVPENQGLRPIEDEEPQVGAKPRFVESKEEP